MDIEKHYPVASLLHPSHLIYALAGSWLYDLSQSLGFQLRALFLLQAANAVLGAGCIFLFHKQLRRLNLSQPASAAGALLLAFSATWWRFAADADAYIPSIFLLLAAHILLEKPRMLASAALLHAGAMLFHELAILFLPVALLQLAQPARRKAVMYTAIALLPAGAAYLAAYAARVPDPTLTGFISWITSHSPDSGFAFNPFTNAFLSLRGTFRLFLGGKPGDFAGDAISIAALAALVLTTAAFAIYCWRLRNSLQGKLPRLSRPLIAWVAIYLAFLFFWMPQNTFYRLFYLPPLIALVIQVVDAVPARRMALALFTGMICLWNFAFVSYPQSRPEFNVPLTFARSQRHAWPPGTPIVFHRFHPDLWTISYFSNQASWIPWEQFDLAALDQYLRHAREQHQPLWLEATAYDFLTSNERGRAWLQAHELPGRALRFTGPKHEFRFHLVQ